jgi:hypothetical protein
MLACNYNPDANIDDGSCVLPEQVHYCLDGYSVNYDPHAIAQDCQTVNGDNSLCHYFDFCSFDFFSAQQDGEVTLDDITYCYENVVFSGASMGNLDGEWEGLTSTDINNLGWGLQWFFNQVDGVGVDQGSVMEDPENGNILGGSFRFRGSMSSGVGEDYGSTYYQVPMSWTGDGTPGNQGWDASGNGWTREFTPQGIIGLMKALFQLAQAEGLYTECGTYGPADCPQSNEEDSFVPDYDTTEAPAMWLSVINNPLYNDIDEDEIPWSVGFCEDVPPNEV